MAKKVFPSTTMPSVNSLTADNPSEFITTLVIDPLQIALATQQEDTKVQMLTQIYKVLKVVNHNLKSKLQKVKH